MTRERDYEHICERLAGVSCPHQNLSLIKTHFEEEINSARRFDRINNVADLLKILEKRDTVSVDNIDPLRYIAEALQNNDLIVLVEAYARPQLPPVLIEPLTNNRVIRGIETDPIERVYDLICTEMGQKWKDFARVLNVPEGQIDELEAVYRRSSDMVREVLRFQRESSDPRYWRVNLCDGLARARRADLSLRAQKIFAMHNQM